MSLLVILMCFVNRFAFFEHSLSYFSKEKRYTRIPHPFFSVDGCNRIITCWVLENLNPEWDARWGYKIHQTV
jgi:hypothetical protein